MIGVPDARWGQTVKAVVVVATDRGATADEIIEHCPRSRSPRTRSRGHVVFVDATAAQRGFTPTTTPSTSAYGGGGYPIV